VTTGAPPTIRAKFPPDAQEAIAERVRRALEEQVAKRVWRRDATLWGRPGEAEIEDRLGWLTVSETMLEHAAELHAFARTCRDDGFTDAVLLGMGGSSLGLEVIRRSFGEVPDGLRLRVLDSTHPDAVLELQQSVDLARTLSDIGGRYSVLSYFGLVPAALMGVNIEALLHQRPAQPLEHANVGEGENPMRANVWSGRNTVQVENVPDPKILNRQDAIVKISSTAICGSDLHLYDGYIPTMEKGDILGHEFMGEIVETGPDVQRLKVGDRVVVPFPIACGRCEACQREQYSVCENSNPNAGMAEKLFGHACAGIFGYSHLTGGYAGGQAEYARVPFADVGLIKIEEELEDEQVLFLSDIFPTGFMGAEMAEPSPDKVIAVFGAGPVGQFAIASARLPGPSR
jgi:hypothetical protein